MGFLEPMEPPLDLPLRRVVGLHRILAGNITLNYYMLGIHYSIVNAVSNPGVAVRLEGNVLLGVSLTVIEINIKKVQKQKNIKKHKHVRTACQKVRKQGRDDIIVKVKLQSPIPTPFYTTVSVRKMQG